MRRVDEMEAELRLFWRISKEARESTDEADAAELADELDAFGQHVEWPKLRARCLAEAAELTPAEAVVARA
jgi:hypothetical protein